jgi:hypothetical protein
MDMELLIAIGNIQTALVILGVVLSFIKFRHRDAQIITLGIALMVSAFSNLLGSILIEFQITPNYAVTLYYILIFPIISTVYYHAFKKKFRKVFITNSVLYILFGLYNLFFIQGSEINSYTKLLMSIITIFYALYYFYWLLKELPATRLSLLPMFWINSAYIVFFSGTLFLSGLTSYIINVLKDNFIFYLTLQNILGTFQVLMFLVALIIDLRNISAVNKSQRNA